jgi:hypothetical protein
MVGILLFTSQIKIPVKDFFVKKKGWSLVEKRIDIEKSLWYSRIHQKGG